VIEAGMQALDKALQINPQYDDAMAYMNLLIRERADLRDTVDQYRQDTTSADEWVQKALAAKRLKLENRQGQAIPQQPQSTPQRITIGGNVQESKLLNRTPPVYPDLALQARISGTVRLQAIIGKDGHIVDLKVVSGHPLLIPAALDAVKLWVYQPTLLNGNPVEVATQIDLNFELP
jgi:TonB family protein